MPTNKKTEADKLDTDISDLDAYRVEILARDVAEAAVIATAQEIVVDVLSRSLTNAPLDIAVSGLALFLTGVQLMGEEFDPREQFDAWREALGVDGLALVRRAIIIADARA